MVMGPLVIFKTWLALSSAMRKPLPELKNDLSPGKPDGESSLNATVSLLGSSTTAPNVPCKPCAVSVNVVLVPPSLKGKLKSVCPYAETRLVRSVPRKSAASLGGMVGWFMMLCRFNNEEDGWEIIPRRCRVPEVR